jgi:hypothetical protein
MKKTVPILCLLFGLQLAPLAQAQYSSVNEALSLTGGGFVSVPYSGAFNSLLNQIGMLSIDAWVYPSSLSGYMTIVGNDWTVGYWLGIAPTGKVRFYPRGNLVYESSGAIPSGQWSHVAVAFNARKQNLSFYINGTLSGTASVPAGGVGSVTGGDLRIGADRQSGSPSYYWSGMIDEVRIWNDEINFATAVGLLYRVPHAVFNGRLGKALVAGWRLNGDADGIDNQYNGTLSGSTAFASAPLPPHYARICASFSNIQPVTNAGTNDCFTIPSSSTNALTQNYTIECWVKPASTGGSTAFQTFVSKGSLDASVWSHWVGLNKSNGKVRFVPNGVFADGVESSSSPALNQWTHVAARYQNVSNVRTAFIFINGTLAGSKTYKTDAATNQFPMYIGKVDGSASPSSYGFSGFLDEVRVWNTPRSDEQILNNYRIELSGGVSNLAASYHFDGDVIDASGNANNGAHTLASSSDVYFADASDLPAPPTVQLLQPTNGSTWFIGNTRAVQWTSTGLQNVRIELSRDGGASFPEVISPSTPAASGSFNWLVTGPETQNARVRITTTTPTPVSDRNTKDFTIVEPPPTLSAVPGSLTFAGLQGGALPAAQRVRLKNTGGGTMSWTAAIGSSPWIALSQNAGTANVDSFDVSISTTSIPEGSYSETITLTGNFSNSPVTIPVVFRVTKKLILSISGLVRRGSVPLPSIQIAIAGDVTANVSTQSNGLYTAAGLPQGDYTVTPANPFLDFSPASRTYTPLASNVTDADFTAQSKRGRVMLRYRQGWNLVSLPLIPDITDLATLIPAAQTPAYLYDPSKGYLPTSTVGSGKMAFWMLCTRTDSTELTGELLPAVLESVTSGYGGWNLIGAPSGPASVAAFEQSPNGLAVAVFEYDPVLGYIAPVGGQVRPGRAYFLKAAGDGSVRITAESAFAPHVSLPSLRFPGATVLWNAPPPPPPDNR